MEARLLGALFARPTLTIMGRRLRPFSLAHRVTLEAIESPFVRGGKATPEDLLAALRICSSDTPFSPIGKPTWRDKYECARMLYSPTRLQVGCLEFSAYMHEHGAHPELWGSSSKGASDGIPWELHVVARLVRSGFTEREAWTMSEARAVWLNVAFARQEGCELSVMTETERAMIDAVKTSNPTKQ